MRKYQQRGKTIEHSCLNLSRRSQNVSKNTSQNSSDFYPGEEEVLNYDAYGDQGYGIKDSTNDVRLDYGGQSEDDYMNGYNYDKNAKENGYNYQNQNPNQKRGQGPPPGDKKVGFYSFNKPYQTEAILEAPDEGDY